MDDILDLLLSMMTPKKDSPSLAPDKYTIIIQSAEHVFAKNGFKNTTTALVAQTANVSEATIYEYFENKENLLLSLLDLHLHNNLNSLDSLFDIRTPLSKIKHFMHHHFMLFLKQPTFMKIFLLDAIYNPSFYNSKAYPAYKRYIATIDEILEEGKKAGIFRPEIDNRIFKNVFIGAFTHMALRWSFTVSGGNADKISEINALIEMLTGAIQL
jgi:TetR/AcrR family fatty acid metabolism transcriptional regulator